MKGTTHALIGASAALLGAQNIGASPEWTGAYMLLSALGGLLPDIDHPNSIIGRRFPLPLWWLTGHRGITHSVWAVLACVALSPVHWALALVALGYVLHVVCDMLTVNGVRVWVPLSRERVRLLPGFMSLRTGGISERLIAATCAILIAYTVVEQLGRAL